MDVTYIETKALKDAITLLNKYQKEIKSVSELIKVKETKEILNGLYYKLLGGKQWKYTKL